MDVFDQLDIHGQIVKINVRDLGKKINYEKMIKIFITLLKID
jgi:hypothetical protein